MPARIYKLLYYCFTAALLLTEAGGKRTTAKIYRAALLLLYCCFTAALLLTFLLTEAGGKRMTAKI